ncbi:methyltransferase domain-containing protein [Halogeometricum limi]|uniref:Methyltransferase domain-containing protein n=1 Tax=Halogeometricum limi TaxID=555875 RepID=A0A1I6HTP7_9EURY|nr:methyltransferase domain-containing protein [Halogeometricum limi]SFR57803.1 Methyltransferase domain-containing protein [Halogeometricum limi]
MRDEVLERWVKQPAAAPIVQYLRDAEKESAWELLGRRGRVLDLASEVNVTRGLDAERVTRLDFAEGASESARDALGDDVDEYAWTDPEAPTLPFPDDHFDGAVSIGPYDWRFLDVERLTAEVRRVVGSEGRFVFSVPTPRSPYFAGGKHRMRYYDPDEARRLFAPRWQLADYDLVYQLPQRVHAHAGHLPWSVQGPFVDLSERLSERLSARDAWEDASYLVLAVEPFDYDAHLDAALDCLFRPTRENGFWDGANERLLRALDYRVDADGEQIVEWTPNDENQWRYATFALAGLLQWRVSDRGTDAYDERLRSQLAHFREAVSDETTREEMPSYGLGPLVAAFSLASDVFDSDDESGDHLAVARDLQAYTADRFDFSNSEDSLLLYGWTYLYERDPTDALRDDVVRAMDAVVDRQDGWETLFLFDNPTTRRHQNQMYTLWGLARAIEVTGLTGYLENVERVLDYTVENRMRDDGAFLWEDPTRRMLVGNELRHRLRGERSPPHWELLYECHQTFFVNAVAHYYAAGGEKNYDREVGDAMGWIYDDSDGPSLVDQSGLGVPTRFQTADGRIDVPGQTFKGAYEVGSYVAALTHLVTGTAER